MDALLLERLDAEIESATEELAELTSRFIRIPSVKGEPQEGAPFGIGPKKLLDDVLRLAEEDGFFTKDYQVGVVEVKSQEKESDLGIWLHGDVVPVGSGWNWDPFGATRYDENTIIGRGATDNKGQLATIYLLLRILRRCQVPLRYGVSLFVGSNEETGMKDLVGDSSIAGAKGFLNVAKPPRLSLVPDGAFPVGYAGKGSLSVTFRSKKKLHGWQIQGGLPECPGGATASFFNREKKEAFSFPCTVEKTEQALAVSTFVPPRHGAHPDPNGNAITLLTRGLLQDGWIPQEDLPTVSFLEAVSRDVKGEFLGIATTHEEMGSLVLASGALTCEEGIPSFSARIRYPFGITYERILEILKQSAEEWGFELSSAVPGSKPYRNDLNSPFVKLLLEAYRSVVPSDKGPVVMSGGTYAHHLPNAYVFGMAGNQVPSDFPKGHGGAHGIDEVVSLPRLKRALKIYIRALLALNEMDW